MLNDCYDFNANLTLKQGLTLTLIELIDKIAGKRTWLRKV